MEKGVVSGGIRKKSLPWLMLSPFLILVFVFYFLPVVLIAVNAFTGMDSALEWNFIGLSNFKKMLLDPNIIEIFKHLHLCFLHPADQCLSLAPGLWTYFIQKENIGLVQDHLMLPRISPLSLRSAVAVV